MKSDFSVQNNVVNVCSSYLCMVFPYNGNVQYPQNDRLPLSSLFFWWKLRKAFSFRHEWFLISASLKVRPRTDDKDFLKTPVVFSGFSTRVARIFPEVRSTYSTKSGNLYEAKRTKRGWVSLMVSFWASSPHCFCVFLYTCLLLCFVLFCR